MAARPRHPRLRTYFLLALLPAAAALRLTGQAAKNGTMAVLTRQQLSNMDDLQYFGAITIGGQTVQGILDTGSFELVVFSKQCSTCGIAGKYDQANSTNYTKGNSTQMHSYGSGSCWATDGYDVVEAEGLKAGHQAMWLATQCEMPLLAEASFHAIVGIGPPGQPELTARATLEDLEAEAETVEATGRELPEELQESIDETEKELKSARERRSMLENFGVKTFSECLGKEPGSPGWLIWNDMTHKGSPGVIEIPVAGNITWGVQVTGMSFGADGESVACRDGCGSIVDTGTSLFAVPTEEYESIFKSLSTFMRSELPPDAPSDCSDLSYFPDLKLTVGGQKLSFPPSAYIGNYIGQVSSEMAQVVRTSFIAHSSCQLLLMDLGQAQNTVLGPMIILGMPFFREYYTTFDLGSGDGNRALFVSKSDADCQPVDGGIISSRADRHRSAVAPRRVDASKLRPPRGLDRLRGRL